MASEDEINAAFARVRELIAKTSGKQSPQLTEIAQIGAFLLEGFLIDVHRIAEAQTALAEDSGNEPTGWARK